MTPSDNGNYRRDIAAMERRDLLTGAPKRPSPLRTEITEEYIQDVERRTQESLRQTRELLDRSDDSSVRLRESLTEAWDAIAALDHTMRQVEHNLNRPGRIQRLRQWGSDTKTDVAERFKRGVDYVSSIPLTQRIAMLVVAILGLLAWMWNSMGIGRNWQQPAVYT